MLGACLLSNPLRRFVPYTYYLLIPDICRHLCKFIVFPFTILQLLQFLGYANSHCQLKEQGIFLFQAPLEFRVFASFVIRLALVLILRNCKDYLGHRPTRLHNVSRLKILFIFHIGMLIFFFVFVFLFFCFFVFLFFFKKHRDLCNVATRKIHIDL
jgi:hypothetical protein